MGQGHHSHSQASGRGHRNHPQGGMQAHQHHDPADHVHHGARPATTRAMLVALILTVAFALVEVFTGWLSGSLALLSDAGHMVSDALSLGLGTLAVWIGKRPPTQRHSYGLQRAEIIAAALNGLLLLGVIGIISVEAFERITHPSPVHPFPVMGVAVLGMILNTLNGWMLSRMEKGLNTRALLIHVLGDFLGSLAALIAGFIIWQTGWMPIDPILSLVVAGLMLNSTFQILSESVHVLMEGVPKTVSLHEVGEQLAHTPGVIAVHDLHIWTLTSGMTALSAHLEVEALAIWPELLTLLRARLIHQHGIEQITLQPELRRPA
ncbi:MAG: cation diffusion facilitator family transporter [Ferrovum sp.]|nr:cation diffusion facilitator family transporter [Ferrovum sp.]NDU89534.1 cation transporter [Ferrovum sp.]